jgi:asparagine synthase (glutamine-hydrolysing)
MCGIVAVWNRDGAPIDLDALARSVGAMRRRGPDDEGYLLFNTRSGRSIQCRGPSSDPRVNMPPLAAAHDHPYDLAFGHRRLSIVDVSADGHQPMSTPDGSLWIVFNGMIHNFLDLRQELRGKGCMFRSHTDTEVILHA